MQPLAFHFGPLTVHWYGVLAALGFYAGLLTAARRARSVGMAPEVIWNMGTWLVIGALLGARIWYVVSYWKEDFAARPLLETLMIHRGGLVFYGGLIGAFATSYIYVRRNGLDAWQMADLMAPSVALGHGIGRIGCLMHGCCYGMACELPWAVHFPVDHETKGAGVHPTQIYEAGLNLLLSLALSRLFQFRKFHGQVFAVYLCSYALLRSFVEAFRGDYPIRYANGLLTPAHLISIGIFSVGALLFLVLRNRLPSPVAR